VLDGIVVDEPAERVLVPPEHRRCGVVFQDNMLFPHLTAEANVAFGLRCRGLSRTQAAQTARVWLEMFELGDRASAKPSRLSGGEAQRVALARALAGDPRLLLLDEPMAALDVEQRGSVRHHLRHHLREFGGSCVVVTHDMLDAAAVADRLVVIENGAVVQKGTLEEFAAQPRTAYVAQLTGLNLLEGTARGTELSLAMGPVLSTTSPMTGRVLAVVAPRDVALHVDPPTGSPRNTWATRVEEIHLLGERVRVVVGAPIRLTAEITMVSLSKLGLTEGAPVWISFKSTQIDVFPDDPAG
jgi:molybdate transport system ATP-binding protein